MKILVGTDFSELAARAADKANELARSCGGELHLVHVVEPVDEPDSNDPETEAFYEKLTGKSRERLAEESRRLGQDPAASSVLIGHRHQALIELAEKMPADILVLGSRPLTSPSERPGVSHRVALISSRPVLLVP